MPPVYISSSVELSDLFGKTVEWYKQPIYNDFCRNSGDPW